MVRQTAAVEIFIDELVLDGFPSSASFTDRDRLSFSEALQAELNRLFEEGGLPAELSSLIRSMSPSPAIDLDGGIITLPQSGQVSSLVSAAGLGKQSARGLYQSFTAPAAFSGSEK